MSEQKIVKRRVAIALAIACIVLVAGLGVTIGYYAIAVNDKDQKINNLTDSINLLNNTVNIANFTVLAENQTVNIAAGNYTTWTFTANYAGYILFCVLYRTSNNTYIQVSYNATVPGLVYTNGKPEYLDGAQHYYRYSAQDNFTSGVFPILPSCVISDNVPVRVGTFVRIRVGNTSTVENVTEGVTIVYYY